MANRKVALVRSLKLNGKWIHTRPFVSLKGRSEKERVSPDYVILKKQKFLVPVGTPTKWKVFFYQGQRQRLIPCEDILDAVSQKAQWEAKLALRAAGGTVAEDIKRPSLQTLATEWQDEAELRDLDKDTLGGYAIVVNEFLKVCGRAFADELVHRDTLRYLAALRDEKRDGGPLSKRTGANRLVVLKSFLKFCKVDANELVQKKDKPRFTKLKPESYSIEEMQKILDAARSQGKERLALAIEVGIKTGMRKMEIANLEWAMVNLKDRKIHLKSDDSGDFEIKDREDRNSIRLEAGLAERLTDWRRRHPKTRLVFGTSGDLPDKKLLEKMKACAKKAGVKVNGRLYFHKFRSSFMSHMQGKVKLATLMDMTGHSDLKSVMRYLAVNEEEKLPALDQVFGDLG
jgi:integrase